ncbi:MAG TPA: glycosyltransferase family 39 protein [Blastocatellia bacterium]|jgi:4-amino-4-deoxy-L-arabinose transferase-like glycosyltransferase|nr:glycosyltransferase family 39 protein [Blastocatellia bacterium]
MTLLGFFVLLVILSLLLRIFYAGHLYQDDGFWFTSAEEILRGKALYREIYFDKPPVLPLLYALLFKAFGTHILTIRLFTVLYSVAISAVLYTLGKRLYNPRVACLGAGMFVVFSTTYTTGHVQGLNTDFLMMLPYTAGAYFFIRSRFERDERRAGAWKRSFALFGGALVGVAFQVNPKAAFDLLFFGIFLLISRRWSRRPNEAAFSPKGASGTPRRDVIRWSLFAQALGGFAAASLPFIGYLAARQSLGAYWQYVWAWGSRYAAYYPASDVLASALRQSVAYFGLNNTLLVGLAFVTAKTIRRARAAPNAARHTEEAVDQDLIHRRSWESDLTLLIWFATSFTGLTVGGRFFGHYFFQIMPSLCLIGARGLSGISSALQRRGARRIVFALLAAGFAFTIVRFHGRTAVLAADWFRGTRSASTAGWYHERLNREERRVASVVRELPDKEESADQVGLEDIRRDGGRSGEVGGPHDYLFVWGYRPEIYYWSGLLPASRYLSTQPLTGIPADVHYFESERRLLFDEAITAQAREQLVRDLEETRPRYIVDELGMFNPELSLEDYSEMHEFMENYRYYGTTDRFLIYRRREDRRRR